MKVLVRVSGTERMANKEGIFSFLEIVRRGVIADQSANNRNASGKFVSSLEIREIKKGGQLVSEDYGQQLVTGRRPGKFPPLKPIEDWIEEKGLNLKGITKKSLAFVIARKIAKKGTDIYMKKRAGLPIQELVETNEPGLRRSFVKAGKIAITTGIAKALGRKPAQRLQA